MEGREREWREMKEEIKHFKPNMVKIFTTKIEAIQFASEMR